MTEELEPTDVAEVVGVDPRHMLVDWADGHDGWVRRLVSYVMSARQPVSDVQTAELLALFLAEKGIEGDMPEIEPDLEYASDASAAAEELRLTKLSAVCGVNALTKGEEINFAPGLTILYGENGTGKTGYARVLKRLGGMRDAEAILPNIHLDAGESPSATINYDLGGTALELSWNDEFGVPPFTRLSVFDSPAVNVRVDANINYVYIPAELSLFEYVTAGVRAVQEAAKEHIKEILPTTNPFIKGFQQGTTIFQQIETLGSASDLAELELLAVLPEGALDEKEALERLVASLTSNLAESALTAQEELTRTLLELGELADLVTGFDRDGYNEALAGAAQLRESYRQVREESFGPGVLPGPPDDEWQRFVAAAQHYQDHLASPDYPSDGDQCLYCRQPLDEAAVDLIGRSASFLDDKLGSEIGSAERAVADLSKVLASVRLDGHRDAIERHVKAEHVDEVFGVARQLLGLLEKSKAEIAAGDRVSSTELLDWATQLRTAIVGPMAVYEAGVVEMKTQLKDREASIRENGDKLRALNAKIDLDRRLPEIRAYVASAKKAERLRRVVDPLSKVLTSLTSVSKVASQDLINRDFQALFEEECAALDSPNVQLEFVGRKGQAQRRKSVTAEHRPSQTLSEGEQKTLALADFIAEARMGGSAAPIVFDDPVNSLDHRRLKEVADRIATLSEVRQVIVFTHNIWLATELLGRCEERVKREKKDAGAESCRYYSISDDEHTGAKGFVTCDSGPRWDTPGKLAGKVEVLLQEAAPLSGVSQEALVESAYGLMRSWCEVAVEETIFGDVTRRYRANVMMGGFKNVHPDRMQAAIDVVTDLFERACRFIPDHSQPLPTLSRRPSLAEAEADWKRAKDAIAVYRKG